MTGTPVGRGIGQPHALDAAAVIGREFLALHGHGQLRLAVFRTQQLGTQADLRPKALAPATEFGQIGQRLGRSEFDLDPAGVLKRDDAILEHLHRRADRGAERNGVDPLFVAHEIGKGQGVQVVNPGGRTQRPGGLVFQPARRLLILRAAGDRVMGAVDGRYPPAGNGAAETGGVAHQIGLAVGCPGFGHGLGGNLRRALELDVAVVAGRKRPGFVDHVHQNLGAVGRQSLARHGVFRQHLLARGGGLEESRHVVDGNALGAPDGNGLQVLRPHHRADAGTPGGAVHVVDDAGEFHTFLTGHAD